ncbi:MAG TPA: ice-binding family protein [Thermoanaerobaculia bacterium]|jgi:hypothetical protein|nr:ice-binding family protein [Thermoanaerobaculia bacterium]
MRSLLAIALFSWTAVVSAQVAAPPLGAAASFAVLGGSSVTGSGARVGGNVGVSPGEAISGPITFTVGGKFRNDVTARAAQRDAGDAYGKLAALSCKPLPNVRPPPGVYCIVPAFSGTLILDGDQAAVWIFQAAGDFAAAPDTKVLLLNGASRDNIFWQVPGSATLGSNTLFAGNLLAVGNIDVPSGARLSGRALAQKGAVTLGEAFVSMCCPLVALSPPALADAVVGAAYEQTITPAGATVTSGMLPEGLTPAVSGTPTTTGRYRFTLTATNGEGCSGTQEYEINVVCPAIRGGTSPITGASTTLPAGMAGIPYQSLQLPVVGGTPPYEFKVLTASDPPLPIGLPPGLTVSPSGLLSGTPTKGGSYRFNVDVTSSGSCIPHRITYSITIFPLPEGG